MRSDNKGDLWYWYRPNCFFFLWSNRNIRINGVWPNLVQHHEILTTEKSINVSSWRHYNFFSWLLSINETNRNGRSRRKSSSNRPECQNCDKSCQRTQHWHFRCLFLWFSLLNSHNFFWQNCKYLECKQFGNCSDHQRRDAAGKESKFNLFWQLNRHIPHCMHLCEDLENENR